ncbi:DNA sulfur modification protein DndD [Planktothrix agardhii 1806]|jgi:DNA sulfur modification protein DndD|uniref:DNA sulfur modification protein DndD n=1 Tax=Planktothrix agardhii TaxID=1160 RepID=UPI001F2916B5|nr:DNA sulfur modification protein DndD [Planktothrix agardhii]MCF3606677.1 DNA sulfur modification protein DndD [Planktothrix agardhii 1033]MCF3571274.1 DNA sulfur modification protein DndD [Planktothrix agardhii 1805]MCF3585836.1 DNA sulfur modification protein DndD [Planktothrix agardhii 1803]MCF3602513.1 DNA sulfur modification protein DndD [Planktothrix agardhii 1804]MCF3616576.1 DNA sulfur modification protein DndD [Planktothrix agardhii 1806]
MIFLELTLENFGPYRGKQVIDLRPKINDNVISPIILFGGMNGGGKTTLMDAMRLALYGQRAQCSTRGNLSYPDFLKQAVNKQTLAHEETSVELLFEHIVKNMQVEFRVKRRWTKNPKNGKDILGILIDDWPDSAWVETWDERIEDFFPIGISNLFLFDGEQVKELADLDSPPNVVVQAIQSLLGLELSERLAVDLDILANRKRKQLADSKELAYLEEIETKLNQYKSEKDAAEIAVEELKIKAGIAKKKLNQAKEKFKLEGGKIAGERSQLEKKLEDEKEKAKQQRERLCELASEGLPLNLIQPLLIQAQNQGKQELNWEKAKIAQDFIKDRDQRLFQYLEKLNIAKKQLESVKIYLETDYQNLTENHPNQEKIFLEIDDKIFSQLGTFLDHQLPSQIQQSQDVLEALIIIEDTLSSLDRQLAIAAPPEVYEQLLETVSQAQTEYTKIETAIEDAEQRSKKCYTEYEKAKKHLEKYSQNTIDRKNANHIIETISKVQDSLKIFKEKLTLKKLNKLEVEVTECFRYLLHKSDLVHRVVIATEDFSLSLYDPQGQPVEKHRLSAGEKQLLAIAFLWGLARVSGLNLPIAIDTPLGRLDSSHRQNLIERYFPAASHQVILLSTDTEIAEKEINSLREQDAIAREYLLKYDPKQRQTRIALGYFF